MAIQASWVSGNVAQVEVPGASRLLVVDATPHSNVVGRRVGSGITFRSRAGQSNWFHFAIPTPVIVNDVRARLERVFVMYWIDAGARLNAVHVWDGPNPIQAYSGLGYTGAHFNDIDTQNNWAGGGGEVRFGIGISVLVEAQPGTDARLYFASAGADFRV
jgi:hypothetical protein